MKGGDEQMDNVTILFSNGMAPVSYVNVTLLIYKGKCITITNRDAMASYDIDDIDSIEVY